jgi:hypothetical protein
MTRLFLRNPLLTAALSVVLLVTVVVLFQPKPVYADSIALDVASAGSTGGTGASPVTWTQTVTSSGTNTYLIVGFCTSVSGSTQPTVTGVTYNSVAMTKVQANQNGGGTIKTESSVWFLKNPSTGSNTVSVSFTGGTSLLGAGSSVSYTGVNQTNSADAVGGTTGTATGVQSFNVVTVADNSWVFATACGRSAAGPTFTATQTSRWAFAGANRDYTAGEDTNGVVTPAGTKSMGFTESGSTPVWSMSGASFAPAASVTITSAPGTVFFQ